MALTFAAGVLLAGPGAGGVANAGHLDIGYCLPKECTHLDLPSGVPTPPPPVVGPGRLACAFVDTTVIPLGEENEVTLCEGLLEGRVAAARLGESEIVYADGPDWLGARVDDVEGWVNWAPHPPPP